VQQVWRGAAQRVERLYFMARFGGQVARRTAPLNVMSHDDWETIELDPQLGEYVYMNAKTAAQRQAEREDRELAAGRVHWNHWVRTDIAPPPPTPYDGDRTPDAR